MSDQTVYDPQALHDLADRLNDVARRLDGARRALEIAVDRLTIIGNFGGVQGQWATDALQQMVVAYGGGDSAHLRAVAEMDAQVAADQRFDAECRARDGVR